MRNNIENFLGYEGNYAKHWLYQAVYFVVLFNPENKRLKDIFELLDIEIDGKTFLHEIENFMKENNEMEDDKIRSPPKLMKYINTWVYYSVDWAFDLNSIHKKNYKKYRMITNMVLEFHYYYIRYITLVDEVSRINIKSIEYVSGAICRAIEILGRMTQESSAYLTEKYFPDDVEDLFSHFIKIIQDDYIEKECFLIKENSSKKGENFIKYSNPYIGVSFQVLLSRRISQGTGNESAEERSHKDEIKIVGYLVKGYHDYQKIITLEHGKGVKSETEIGERASDQIIKKEKLIKEGSLQEEIIDEEKIEADMTKENNFRAALESNDIKAIPDQFKQRMINRSFSASIAKQNQMLNATYEIPDIKNLSILINHISEYKFDVEFSKNNLFISIFFLSVILGRDYKTMVQLLLESESGSCTITIEKKLFTVELDIAFGSALDGFSLKNGKTISFQLPEGIVSLYKYIREQIICMPKDAQKNLDKYEPEYKKFIEKKINSCPIYMNIDLNNLWKVLVVYSRNLFENNIASLFCIGKNTTLDTSVLSYTNTHKSGQVHSIFLNNLYKDLGMLSCINHLMDTPDVVENEIYLFDKKLEYVGSKRLVKQEKIKKFFSLLRRAMLHEDDKIKYFNLYAIYVRYSLSLLLGTRLGIESCNLKDISFELHLMRIIEKSDDKLTGVRFIPMCNEAEKIIKKYKTLCKELGFDGSNVFFLDKNKKRILYGEKKKKLVMIMEQEYEVDQNILDFIQKVPLNFGRHIAVKVAVENNFNIYYLQTMMGHYTKGTEQFGLVSTTDSQDYSLQTRDFFSAIGRQYGI